LHDCYDHCFRQINKMFLNVLTSFVMGERIFKKLAEPYIAGHSLKQGIHSIKQFAKQKRYSTFSILGEDAVTVHKADYYLDAYEHIVDVLAEEIKPKHVCSLSVKPTSICAIDENNPVLLQKTPFRPRLEKLAKYARKKGINMTLDMEDHNWTDLTLNGARYLWKKGYKNIGIVLQSRLHRTKKDIKNLFSKKYPIPKSSMRVRACIGIYNEPNKYATIRRSIAKEWLVERIEELFDAGVYVEIATHDHKVIHQVIELIERKKIPKNRFEFQFLKGVENAYAIENFLLKKGYKVRYYMPVELQLDDGVPYMKRRLIANPHMVVVGVKNVLQRMLRAFFS